MRTLIGGTMLGSVGFDFLIEDGDVTFSACERQLPEPHIAGVYLAPVGGMKVVKLVWWPVLGKTSIAPVLFDT
jgi:hypothetical protein